MSQRPAVVGRTNESSRKCFHCGLRNFAAASRCARCGYDVWLPLPGSENDEQVTSKTEFGKLKASGLISVVVLLLGLGLTYTNQDSRVASPAVSQAAVAQPAKQPTEQTQQIALEDRESPEAANEVLTVLERFQRATESTMSYEEYDESLTSLKAHLIRTLPLFIDHAPEDETFRSEVDAALRDYTAAGNWWKTADRNSAVLTDADKTERLIANWTSAKTHLHNAGQMLVR